MEFMLDNSLSETELNSLVRATEADNCRLRAIIARNDTINAMAKVRLIGLQVQEAERE